MENKKEISFLPFHAINEFMLDEYRLKIIRTTIESLTDLPDHYQSSINKLTKKLVKIHGFRNSVKAPVGIKVKAMARTFEKSPAFVAAILSAWAKINSSLGMQIFELLSNRNWDLLPIDADRSKLPGFLPIWPEGEGFEDIYEAYIQLYPEANIDKDDVSLMVVWLGGRLPYQFSKPEEEVTQHSA